MWAYRSTDNKTNKIIRSIVTHVEDTPLPLLSEMICVGCGHTVVCLTEVVVVTWTVLDEISLVLDEIILVEEVLCEDLFVEDVVDDQTIEVVDTVIIEEKT